MKKKTKRKTRWINNPLAFVLESIRPVNDDDLRKLLTVELACLDAFAKGHATLQDYVEIEFVCNLSETMAMAGVGPEVLETCQKAQAHLLDAANRFTATAKMGTTGLGLAAFRDLIEYHDLQRQAVTLGEYEGFIKKTKQRVKSKAPGVVEV
jgi:hypothetical protein